MHYDLQLLNSIELNSLSTLLKKYKDYDKIDILIELTIGEKNDILSREKNKEKKEEKIINNIPEELKFCDGDKCSVY